MRVNWNLIRKVRPEGRGTSHGAEVSTGRAHPEGGGARVCDARAPEPVAEPVETFTQVNSRLMFQHAPRVPQLPEDTADMALTSADLTKARRSAEYIPQKVDQLA
jgi:hypothetical protein